MQINSRYFFLLIVICFFFVHAAARKSYAVSSPDGNIVYTGSIVNNTFYYRLTYKTKTIIENSPVLLLFKETSFTNNVAVNKAQITEGAEDYTLIVGKAKHITDRYKQLIIHLQQLQSPFLQYAIAIKIFNDGVAFQYQLPQWQNHTEFTLLQEHTSFNIADNPLVRTLLFDNYTSSHEGVYQKKLLADLQKNILLDLPALFERKDNICFSITEAALVDYAGMYLSKQNSNSLVSKLSPWPTDTTIKVQSPLPHKSPWRVILISDRIGSLVESNIITSLNEPCKIENTGWIKPGKTTFPWWNGNVLPDTINAPGNNFVTAQYYIDFCARNKIEYHSVVEYGLHQWYMDDGIGFQPGPHTDVTTPVPGLDMKEICDYAHSKNVDVRVWVHWAALYPKLDTAFVLFEKWGLSGMMVDFMDRDDQQMVNIQNEILEKAAKHHLHIQFHGAYKSTGLHRTWPNEFTREGTLNYEANKWAAYITPDMDIDIPFTRMLAGSTDYHLGGFRAVPASQIKPNYTRPLMLGTRCHMLAMYVVLENYLQMVCDYPEAYEGQPGFEFIKEIPTTWDETKVLDAKPGEYIVIARKKNDAWYIGAITNSQERTLQINFKFAGEENFNATMYSDAEDAASNPNHIDKRSFQLNKNTGLSLKLAAGGGTVIQLVKK
jgi:alpha-glucosidase